MNNSAKVTLGDVSVGHLLHMPGERFAFEFDDSYLNLNKRPTLSLSYFDTRNALITNAQITQTKAPPFFSNLLPEGQHRQYLAQKANVDPNREFPFLCQRGDELPGNIHIKPDNTEEETSATHSPDTKTLRFSLPGSQLKLPASFKPSGGFIIPSNGIGSNWIIKLPSSQFPQALENEFTMMSFAKKLGLNVPHIELININDIHGLPEDLPFMQEEKALAIKRFDRTNTGRIHCEDFAQIFNIYPDKKYEHASGALLLSMIYQTMPNECVIEFLKRLVFSIFIGNGSMHLKKWAATYPDTINPELAPGYGFLSTAIYLPQNKLAFKIDGTQNYHEITSKHLINMADKARIPMSFMHDTIAFIDTIKSEYSSFMTHEGKLTKELQKRLNTHIQRLDL